MSTQQERRNEGNKAMKKPCPGFQGYTKQTEKGYSPAGEVFLDLPALAGAVFLRSAGSYQRGLRTVCANQHVPLSLFILL